MQYSYDVFISVKNLDENGNKTQDFNLASHIHDFLSKKGFNIFFSDIVLEECGITAYQKAIDDALDSAQILLAIGTSKTNLESRWVRYEWSSFFNDILSGIKPDGKIFVYIENIKPYELPRALRQSQCIEHSPDSFDRLYRFISNALNKNEVNSRKNDTDKLQIKKYVDINGSWEGTWKRKPDGIVHIGYLEIYQKKQSIDATITVTFEIDGHKSILNEFFSGNIIGEILHLQGQSINYIEKGNPHNYVLDNFYLDINKNGDILKGKFKSRAGSGNALFKKIEKISPEDYHELL